MLTTKILYSSGETKRYYSSDKSKDYYVTEDRDKIVSGELAKMLGITEFDTKQFFALCDGKNPVTGDKLTPRPRKTGKARVALDMTVSCPKSVTEAMMIAGDGRLFEAMSRANQDVLRLQEQDMCVRERVGGADYDRPTGNHICYSFWDPTTRPEEGQVDAHGHWHNVIINATFDPVKGRIMAAQLQKFDQNGLKLYRPYYQAYFNNQLRRYVEELGYKTRTTEFAFEIEGIEQESLDIMSRRTQKINAEAEKRGLGDEAKGKLGAKLRQGKIPVQPWEELVAEWKGRLGTELMSELEAVYAKSFQNKEVPQLENGEALDYALEHKQYRQSAVPEREILTEAMKHRMGRTSLEGLKKELERPELVRGDWKGVPYVSSFDIRGEEDAVIQFANSGRGEKDMLGKRGWKVPDRAGGHKLTKGQRAAIKHILGSKDPVTLLLGKPGAGKTEVLKSVRPQLAVNSLFIAPTTTASRENLVEAGFADSTTLAAFLKDRELQEQVRDGVMFLDEGSLAGSKDAGDLARSMERLNARLVVVGDLMQHRSASRGDTLRLLVKHAKLPYAHLSEIVRQKGELKEATELFHAGKGIEGILELDRQGRIKIGTVKDLADVYLDAATFVDKKGIRHRGKEAPIVISPTHAGGRDAAGAIRESLKASGVLKGKEEVFDTLRPLQFESPVEMREKLAPGQVAQFFHKTAGFGLGEKVEVTAANLERIKTAKVGSYSLYMPDKTPIAVGEKIRTTNNAQVKGGRVQNGSLYEVKKIEKGEIKLTNGLVLPEGFQNFTQGYVGTSPARQSKTSHTTLVWQPMSTHGATNLEQALVTGSRPTDQLLVFTDSKAWLPKAAQRREERVLAHDLKPERKRKRKPLRERIKKHLSFLRSVAGWYRGQEKEQERAKEASMDRG